MLTPPYHFAIVAAPIPQDAQEILYRGALPAPRNASFVRFLKLRTLVVLRKKALKDDDALAIWAKRQGIDVQWVKAERMGEESLGMEREQVGDVLKILLNPAAYPIYLADVDGISHTTLVVACLRKLQGWHQDSIVNEIYRFEPDHDDFPLVPFITSYLSSSGPSKDDPGGALALPPPPYPSWLWPAPVPLPPSQKATPSTANRGERERAVSSASASSTASSTPLPFPNPLTARRHPNMRLQFSAVPPPAPPPAVEPVPTKAATGLWRTRSNTALSRVSTTDRPRPASPHNSGREDSIPSVSGGSPRAPHKVSFHDNLVTSGILSQSPVAATTLPSLRFTDEGQTLNGGSAVVEGEDDPKAEYAIESEEDEDEEYPQSDEDEEDEEEYEDEEEEEENPVSQYISALDLAGL